MNLTQTPACVGRLPSIQLFSTSVSTVALVVSNLIVEKFELITSGVASAHLSLPEAGDAIDKSIALLEFDWTRT
jgi:hypothetical protein